jgi:hypothetical protein
MCEMYHALPSSGGVLDQDSYIIYGLTAVSAALGQKAEKEQQKQKGPKFTGGPSIRRSR